MTDAARHLEHFLDGSGAPITYNRDRARSFGPVRNAERDAQARIRDAIVEKAQQLKDGESVKLEVNPLPGKHGDTSHGLDLLRGLVGDRNRFNDDLATGRTTIDPTFKGTISRKGKDITVDGTVQHDWNDRYDSTTDNL